MGVLVSLLTACPGSSLGVQLGAKGIEVWGILNADPYWIVAIRIAGPGLLIASDDHQVLAVLERGEELIPAQGAGYDWMQFVAKALPPAVDYTERLQRALVIQRVIAAIHKQGHGGALVIGPRSNHDWMNLVDLRFKFDLDDADVIRKRLAHLEDAQRQLKESRFGVVDPTAAAPSTASPPETLVTANQSLLEELLRQIGDLSAIDGAVVMDEELGILGFGAKLRATAADFQVREIDVLTSASNDVSCSDLGGTRHRSAACLVHQQPETMVFVASQDGRLTLFVWVEDIKNVAAVRRLEHFISTSAFR